MQQTNEASIIWRRLDCPGHESARLFAQDDSWNLQGTAVFSHDQLPCRLDYHIACDSRWNTRRAKVAGWVGDRLIEITLAVSNDQRWLINEEDAHEVAACIDLDLNFSPSTNLLPIRRLNLVVGHEMEVRAAWLRFPSFALEPLTQLYRRIDETTYRYESHGGDFITELSVNEAGFVTRYPDVWEIEEGTL
jgi:hypothetical protein